MRAFRVADVRAAEKSLLAEVPPGSLMQRAAAGLATACARELRSASGGVSGRRVVLLVGGGNNGGDALWAGARLAARGAQVDAVLLSDAVHAEGLAALRSAGGQATDGRNEGTVAAAKVARADLVVDGIVGLGASPGLRQPAADLVAGIPASVPVVAVDLPSGVDPDTGKTPGPHVRATVTVTFGAAKPCLLLPPGEAAAGRVEVVDIGLTPRLPATAAVERLDGDAAAAMWPVPHPGDDKYRRGVVGVVAGSTPYPGAAVLACGAALRTGVGMIRYQGPEAVTDAVRAAWPEVVAGPGRVQGWVLGPGVDPEGADDQPAAIEHAIASGEPCLVDAGALGIWCRARSLPGAQAPDDVSDRVLLTPHAGELSRLLGDLGHPVERGEVEADPQRHARRAAELTGATVLLKGQTTLLSRPDGRLRSQVDGPPWLATAGAGDVLAGIAGALLAGGLSAWDAGAVGTLVHGRAARAASGGGPISAADVTAAVPAVVTALLRGAP